MNRALILLAVLFSSKVLAGAGSSKMKLALTIAEHAPTRVELFSVRSLANGNIPRIPSNIERIYLPNFERSSQSHIEKAIYNMKAIYPAKKLVAYIPVRKYTKEEAEELLRFYQENGITEIVVLAGGKFPNVKGQNKFEDSETFLKTMELRNYHIDTVGIAAHPEHHPLMNRAQRMEALKVKYDLAKAQGLDLYMITQTIGSPANFVKWQREVRDAGIDSKIYYGSPLPKMKHSFYQKFVGITQALSFDLSHPDYDFEAARRINTAGENDQGKVLRDLTQLGAELDGFHFYTYGDNVQEGLDALLKPYDEVESEYHSPSRPENPIKGRPWDIT